jgi:hypothetical protein
MDEKLNDKVIISVALPHNAAKFLGNWLDNEIYNTQRELSDQSLEADLRETAERVLQVLTALHVAIRDAIYGDDPIKPPHS